MVDSQSGISIAAIAIAIVAIGVSAAMVSSMNEDISDLKSTIEKLSQDESRGAIEQQGGDRIIGANTKDDSGSAESGDGKEANFTPPFDMGVPSTEIPDQVENLKDKIRELNRKINNLEIDSNWVYARYDVDPGEFRSGGNTETFDFACPKNDHTIIAISVDKWTGGGQTGSIEFSEDMTQVTITNPKDESRPSVPLIVLPVTYEILYNCASLNIDMPSSRPDVQQQAIPAKGPANVPKGIIKEQQDSKNLISIMPKKSQEDNQIGFNLKLIPPKIQFKEQCGDGIDNDQDGLIDEIPELERYGATNLSNCDLSGVDFSGEYLIGTDFTNADLTGADLSEAYVSHTDFTDADLTDVDFTDADLGYAEFTNSILVNTNFHGATMQLAKFTNSVLDNVDFTYVNKEMLKRSPWQYQNIYFYDSTISNTNFSNGHFTSSSFMTTTISNSNFDRADLSRVTSYHDVIFENVSFVGADLNTAKLEDANLSGADFTNACLGYAKLGDANLSGTDFTNADLSYARMLNANLSGAIFQDTNLWQTVVWENHPNQSISGLEDAAVVETVEIPGLPGCPE